MFAEINGNIDNYLCNAAYRLNLQHSKDFRMCISYVARVTGEFGMASSHRNHGNLVGGIHAFLQPLGLKETHNRPGSS